MGYPRFPQSVPDPKIKDKRMRLLAQPAVLYVAYIRDKPIETYRMGPVLWGKGEIVCSYSFFDCWSGLRADGFWGMFFTAALMPGIQNRYDWIKREIQANVPAVGTYIDIRSLEQMMVSCCPKELEYLLE